MSSISNFLLGIYVARELGAADLGAFALAFLTYSVVLNASRGLSTDPLVVRFSGSATSAWRSAVASASGTAVVVGIVAGVLCVVSGLALQAADNAVLGQVFLVLGVGLPGLMLQDSWRFAFFSVGRGAQAFLNDTVWTVLIVTGLVLSHVTGGASVTRAVMVFGMAAAVAAAFGVAQTRIAPRPRDLGPWLRANRTLAPRYLVENVSSSGASQLRAIILGAVAGLAAVGDVRAAEMLVGPFLVVLFGVAQVAVPEARRWLDRGRAALLRFCLGLGLVLAGAAAAWGVALMLLLPLGLGDLLLGTVWLRAYPLVPGVVVSAVAACLTVGAMSGLRAMGQARRSLRAQLIGSSLYLLAGSVGAILWAAPGAVWGAAVAGVAAAVVWWVELSRGRDRVAELGESSPSGSHDGGNGPEREPLSRVGPRASASASRGTAS